MKYFLSAVMAAGWFCIAMAVFAQSTAPSATPGAAPGHTAAAQGHVDCLKQAIDQRAVGPRRKDFIRNCTREG